MKRTIAGLVLGASAVLGSFGGLILVDDAGRAGTPTGCATGSLRPFDERTALAQGRGIAAAVGSGIVMLGDDGGREMFVPPRDPAGHMRHFATRAGVGIAYVEDRAGPDVVVMAGPGGVTRLPQDAEALHPALSARGELAWAVANEIRIRSGSGRARAIRGPGVAVFSPSFGERDELLVVVAERVAGPDGGAALDNMYRLGLRSEEWTRLTAFTADEDRWSVIRTPLVTGRGRVEFVRVEGVGSVADSPSFELWSLQGGVAAKLRDLPAEMYLAGVQGGRRIWNVFDEALGDWRLFAERPDGSLEDQGCGRVSVDPLRESDPDAGAPEAESGSETQVDAAAAPNVASAVLVGDFSSREAAQVALEEIQMAYADEALIEIVDHEMAPTAVAPGVWAIVIHLAPEQDPAVALADFRSRVPAYSGWSWVVTL